VLTLGGLTFMAPWVLIAASALPLVWLLLRLTPPAVRRLDFPAARLLFNLEPTERTPARTPPWLVALRIGLLALAVFGLADPVLTARQDDGDGPLVVVVDDGWAAANRWDARLKALRNILERAEHRREPVALIATAPAAAPQTPPRFGPAREALARTAEMIPQAWLVDRAAAAAALQRLNAPRNARAIWLSDGVADAGDTGFAAALQEFARVTVMEAEAVAAPLVLLPPQRSLGEAGANRIAVTLRRVVGDRAPPLAHTVRALDADSQVLGRVTVAIARDAGSGSADFALPPELANRVARFDVEGQSGAATTVLADARWQRRPVGIASATAKGITAPLLEDSYYVREALTPFAEVRSGNLDELMARPLSVLFMASGGRILEAEIDRLTRWVDDGGVLVRFAGPALDSNVDPLLPVRLRSGGRSFGGALSWNEPATLAPFPETAPFKGMAVPDDIAVRTQVLAEPTPDLAAKTWARLSDGTPLITAERRGQGWVVLFHVTATPEWSSLPLSGLFVDLLRRLIEMGTGIAGVEGAPDGVLAPLSLLDGLGHLVPPGPTAAPLAARGLDAAKPGPEAAPGLYGASGNSVAFNLSPRLGDLAPARILANAPRMGFDGVARERAMKPWLLSAALALLLLDLLVSFALRGLGPDLRERFPLRRAAGLGVFMLALFAARAPLAAENRPLDPAAVAAVLETRLAYVVTGRNDVDRVSALGLAALTQVLANRTSAEMAQPAAVDLDAGQLSADSLSPYPVIYWRVTAAQARPNARAAAALSAYLHRGGMVVFDAPEQAAAGSPGSVAKLEEILRTIDLPPLIAMNDEHVLTRSFYLLQGLPGRFVDAPVYVEKGSSAHDGVSSVIIGGNDWASAWAREANGLPLFPAVPGGETQREMAYRAGVNMVMYALTGNYKSDQVHLPAIMQRLTQ
jgi:hypothetical protein